MSEVKKETPKKEVSLSNQNLPQEEKSVKPYSDAQVKLIRDTVAKGATPDELKLFLMVAHRTGLDPFTKQIHFVKRWNSKLNREEGAMQTAIDGYRAIAERTGLYAGNDDPIFDNELKPTKATVTVWKLVNGIKCAFTAAARWNQYYPGDKQGFMWKKMPHLMLGKCAEALALRKAFPQVLSGIYTHDEMQQADVIEVNSTPSNGSNGNGKPPEIERPKSQDQVEIIQEVKADDQDWINRITAAKNEAELLEIGKGIEIARTTGKISNGKLASLRALYSQRAKAIKELVK